MKRLLIVNVVLLAVAVLLVAQVVRVWMREPPAIEPVAPRESKPPRVEPRPASRRQPPPDLAEKIAAKDLFDPSRSPPTAESVAVTEEPVKPLTLALMGVMGSPGQREVLVKDQAAPKPIWLREGEQIGGYAVSRIDPTSVVMTAPDGNEVRLMINVEKGKGAAVPATGPAGVQPAPTAVISRPGAPSPAATPMRPQRGGAAGADIKEKIERLREEARRRRGQQAQPPREPQS